MLRSEPDAALDDLILALLEAAHGCDTAARLLHATEAAGLLARLAGEHRQAAERFAELLRQRGELPRLPDPEREAVRDGLELTRTALLGSEPAVLLGSRREELDHAHKILITAAAWDWPEAVALQVASEGSRLLQVGEELDALQAALR
jgi:hypothetical protein